MSTAAKEKITERRSSGPGIGVCSWNILADGLSSGEFMNSGGESVIFWKNRGPKIASNILALLSSRKNEISIVATQENDHPTWILSEIQKHMPQVKMVRCSKGKNSEKFYINRLSDELTNNGHYDKSPTMSLDDHDQKISEFLKASTPDVLEELMSKKGLTCTTYAQEKCPPPDGKQQDDFYHSKDHLAVYYNSDVVRLNTTIDETGLFQNEEGVFRLNFTYPVKTEEYNFDIITAHLKSGENEKGEVKRVKELRAILDEADVCENPIVLMDSNTCGQYRNTILQHRQRATDEGNILSEEMIFVNDLILSKKYKNIIDEDHTNHKSIKMRHAQGSQPKKFGELFYDTIDKIIVPADTEVQPIAVNTLLSSTSVLRVFPAKNSEGINQLRNNPFVRNFLKDVCVDEKWGPEMRNNSTKKMDHFCKTNKRFLGGGGKISNVKEILLGLYPNEHMPSDHPPVAATVFVNAKKATSKRGNSDCDSQQSASNKKPTVIRSAL